METRNSKRVVVGHSGCGWTVRQLEEYKKNRVNHETVMCDKTPDHPLCALAEAYPSHAECSGSDTCKIVSKGFKAAS